MNTIIQFIQETKQVPEDEAKSILSKEKKIVEKFLLKKGYDSSAPECYSLIKVKVRTILGIQEETSATIVKSFKYWLIEQKYV